MTLRYAIFLKFHIKSKRLEPVYFLALLVKVGLSWKPLRHQLFSPYFNFIVHLFTLLECEVVGNILILPLADVLNEHIISLLGWKLPIQMRLEILKFDLQLLTDAFQAAQFSFIKGALKLEVNLSVQVEIFHFKCLLLLLLVELVEPFQTVDVKPKVHDLQKAVFRQKPSSEGILVAGKILEVKLETLASVLCRLGHKVRIRLLWQCFFNDLSKLLDKAVILRVFIEGIWRRWRILKLFHHIIPSMILRVQYRLPLIITCRPILLVILNCLTR